MPPTASFVTALRERVTEALQIRAALQYDNVMAWRGEFWLGDKNARIGPPFLQGETATLCLRRKISTTSPFAGYEKLRRMAIGLNEVLEQPALRSMLPASLEGMRILDLGCGFGDFARRARLEGARSVVGIDISLRMLERAIALT
jgi:SAM-dependent methyltransferase